MEGFSVKCSVLKRSKHEMETLEGRVKSCADDTRKIRRNLRGKISSEEQIGNRLEQLEKRLETHAKELMSFGELAYSIGERYDLAERLVLGEDKFWKNLDVMDGIVGALGEFGVIGSFVTGGVSLDLMEAAVDNIGDGKPKKKWWGMAEYGFEKEDKIWKSFFKKGGEELDELIEKVEWISDPKGIKNRIKDSEFWKAVPENLKEAYEKALKHGDDTTFLKEFSKKAKDAVDDSMKYFPKKDISKILGVGGTAVSLYSAGKDNYQEYLQGEISAGRAVAETVGEVAVDWAVGVGLTAAAVAILPAGAPAVAVGAAVVITGWALDEITQWIAKDQDTSFTEVASDALLDIAETGIDIVQDVGDVIGKGIQNVGDAFCDWVGGRL